VCRSFVLIADHHGGEMHEALGASKKVGAANFDSNGFGQAS
jgi:hypothetical protein